MTMVRSGCDEVLTPERARRNWQLVDAGQSVDGLFGLFLDQASHRHGATRRDLNVVSARRVQIEGTVSELPAWFKVMAFSIDSSETSVITRRLMRPSASTTGVKLSRMPNFLYMIWVVQTWVTGSQE